LQGKRLPTWEPGAHIDVLLPGGLVRQYSLCGSPAADAWEIAVRRAPDSRGGSSWLHTHGRPGTTLEVRGPRNHFRLAEGPALFIAGGIGITPVVPMVERLAGTGHAWHLHYLTRGAAPFAERLAPFGDRVTHYDTSCGPRPDVRALLRDADPNATVYCCGPSALLDAVAAAAASGTEVQVEHFAAPACSLKLKGERSFSVRLSRTGLEVAVGQDETVLDALERSGVFLPSSCREGVCGSCELPLLEGDADHRGSVPSDGATFLSCVSRARSGDLVLDY
jgi:ferredoxin-NADP reductase